MKYSLLLISFYVTNLQAQGGLAFEHDYFESENKWVAIKTSIDSVKNFGFVYMDDAAGLTLNYEGSFTVSKEGIFIPKKIENAGFIFRLKPNNVKVAFIPSNKYSELGIKAYPDWLKIYLGDTSSINHLYQWGFLYNGYGACAKALTFLERAYKINPAYEGLAVELSFSYNCLNQFNNAISVLNNALQSKPTSSYYYKELIYAQVHSGQLEEASKSCRKAISVCVDTTYNGEMCYNLLTGFYTKKDRNNFNLWLDETKKWSISNREWTNNIKSMEAAILN